MALASRRHLTTASVGQGSSHARREEFCYSVLGLRRCILLIDEKFKIFCGSANPPLAQAICRYLGVKLGKTEHGRFSDGETRFQILENVRGADVFVVQPCSQPVDFHLMQLLLMIDAFKRASAWRIRGNSVLRLRPSGPQR